MPGLPSLAERVEFVFEHWTRRYARNAVAAEAVPTVRLARGWELARALAADGGVPVLLHGDLHPGNVLDGDSRGLVAIDPRPCHGDAASEAVDWVFWAPADRSIWEARARQLASALGYDRGRLWSWCAAFAAMLAASEAAHAGRGDRITALLTLAP